MRYESLKLELCCVYNVYKDITLVILKILFVNLCSEWSHTHCL